MRIAEYVTSVPWAHTQTSAIPCQCVLTVRLAAVIWRWDQQAVHVSIPLNISFSDSWLSYEGCKFSFKLISYFPAECEAGFFSATGFVPCLPCPVNAYSNGTTSCESCPPDTLGRANAQSSADVCRSEFFFMYV